MSARTRRPGTAARSMGVFALAVTVTLALTACGDDGDVAAAGAAEDAESAPAGPVDGAGAGNGAAMPTVPGASGEVAAVTGDVAQVQADGTQTAVTWTDDTVVTRQVTGSLADVTAGSCVVALTASSDADGDADGAVNAASVAITEADDDGTCAASGFGGMGGGVGAAMGDRGGELPDGMPTDLPEGRELPEGMEMPTDMPTDGSFPGGWGGGADDERGPGMGGTAVVGVVTEVGADGFVVEVTAFAPGATDTSGDDAVTTRAVIVSDDTTYTATTTAATSDIAVGLCLTALGEEDSAGAITATTVALSEKSDAGCTSRFGGRMPGQGRGDAAQGGGDA